jgi:NADPH2:quinone reductase
MQRQGAEGWQIAPVVLGTVRCHAEMQEPRMQALQVTKIGQAPRLVDIPRPEPGPGEVRVRISACGLNFADLLMIEGRYQVRPALPFVPGMEVAGTVEVLGPGVAAPAPGTRVAALLASGGLAEAVCVPAVRCRALPDGMDPDHAAAFQIAYATSHLALARRAALRPGETLLVTGAAGGVGLTAVEIGKLLGARVIAVARGAERLAIARAAGADEVIDAEAPDLKSALRALGGIDVAYETIGGETFMAALGAMRPEGRLLAIGFAGGTVPQIPANHLLVKNLSVIGLWVGGYSAFRPEALDESLTTLLAWYAEGRIRPHVSRVLPLDRATDGLALLRDRKSTGKVVIRCAQAE